MKIASGILVPSLFSTQTRAELEGVESKLSALVDQLDTVSDAVEHLNVSLGLLSAGEGHECTCACTYI